MANPQIRKRIEDFIAWVNRCLVMRDIAEYCEADYLRDLAAKGEPLTDEGHAKCWEFHSTWKRHYRTQVQPIGEALAEELSNLGEDYPVPVLTVLYYANQGHTLKKLEEVWPREMIKLKALALSLGKKEKKRKPTKRRPGRPAFSKKIFEYAEKLSKKNPQATVNWIFQQCEEHFKDTDIELPDNSYAFQQWYRRRRQNGDKTL